MNVGYLVGTFSTGGAETMLLRQIRHGDRRPVVFRLGGPDDLEAKFRATGATVVNLDVGSIADPRDLNRARSTLARYDLDVLHAHLPYSMVVARLAGRAAGVEAVVATHHNVTAEWGRAIRAVEQATRPLDSREVAVSNAVRESQSSPFDATEWSTIHNGIDVAGFNDEVRSAAVPSELRATLDSDGPVFLNVGRYVPQKAQHLLVEAMDRVASELPESHAVVVGHGPLGDALEARVAELGLEDHVSVTGKVPEIHPYYALADVFVLPSLYEGHPLTALEAMAAELPLVGTRVSGIEETVTPEVGRLVPPRSRESLAEAMLEVARDDPEGMGSRAYQRASEQFDISRMVAAHEELYELLVEG
ncbi:glycosyltransferase [Halorussus salinus]|uniref:glycosyltransferase n=1 Tax=Halorussus salinus TaxID=1364935 RepID=UPI001091D7CC|nr:glycosyltransferase [Halorussus salinus]